MVKAFQKARQNTDGSLAARAFDIVFASKPASSSSSTAPPPTPKQTSAGTRRYDHSIGCALPKQNMAMSCNNWPDQADARTFVSQTVHEVMRETEAATIQRACTTWRELAKFAHDRNLVVSRLTLPQLQTFVSQSMGPVRAYVALKWVVRNLSLTLPIVGLVQPEGMSQKRAIASLPSKKAVVAEPCMIAELEVQIKAAIAAGDPTWVSLFSCWLNTFGTIRERHVQRSLLLRVDSEMMHFICLKGKQKRVRGGFKWPCPRFGINSCDNIGQVASISSSDHNSHQEYGLSEGPYRIRTWLCLSRICPSRPESML